MTLFSAHCANLVKQPATSEAEKDDCYNVRPLRSLADIVRMVEFKERIRRMVATEKEVSENRYS